jgi:type VI secretion system protein ImpG
MEISSILESLQSLNTRPITTRLIRENTPTFCYGLEISLDIDDYGFTGNSIWLFGSILDHFLARLASINSFTQFILTTKNKQKIIYKFPPRIGNNLLL